MVAPSVFESIPQLYFPRLSFGDSRLIAIAVTAAQVRVNGASPAPDSEDVSLLSFAPGRHVARADQRPALDHCCPTPWLRRAGATAACARSMQNQISAASPVPRTLAVACGRLRDYSRGPRPVDAVDRKIT